MRCFNFFNLFTLTMAYRMEGRNVGNLKFTPVEQIKLFSWRNDRWQKSIA